MDKCPFCGSPVTRTIGEYTLTGCFNIFVYGALNDKRNRQCYETQLAAQAALLVECREVVKMIVNTLIDMKSIHPDGLPAKYLSAYEGMILVGPESAAILPKLETMLKEKP
jgi:hypothetical protein